MDKNNYETLNRKLDRLTDAIKNGGKGSGNFGHSGRPGLVGGSGDGKGTSVAEKSDAKPKKNDKISKGLDRSFKEWYSKEYPDDYQLSKIKKGTFRDVIKAMSEGKDVYDIIGDVDSVIRERIFTEIENITGLDYDEDIFSAWMMTGSSDRYKKSEAFKKFEKEYL